VTVENTIGQLYVRTLSLEAEIDALYAGLQTLDLPQLETGNPEQLKRAATVLASGKDFKSFEDSIETYEKRNNSRRRFFKKVGTGLMYGGIITTVSGIVLDEQANRHQSIVDKRRERKPTGYDPDLEQEYYQSLDELEDSVTKEKKSAQRQIEQSMVCTIAGMGGRLLGSDTLPSSKKNSNALDPSEKVGAVVKAVNMFAIGLARNPRIAAELKLPSPKQGDFKGLGTSK
jgi:hypothetical protein